jgi:ComF family protein
MWKTILDLIFPIHCLGCGQEGNFVCLACFEKLPFNKKPPFRFNHSALTGLLVASHYENPLIKKMIHRYKYDFIKGLAEPLGLLMVKKLLANLRSDSLLIPIPLHSKRLRWRGFNQTELLAQQISQKLNIPIANNILIRTKHTLPQVKIKTPHQRKQNIKQAFELRTPKRLVLKMMSLAEQGRHFQDNASGFKQDTASGQRLLDFSNKTLILIDDISTTGATLKEAAKTLRSLKPKTIWGLVVARG